MIYKVKFEEYNGYVAVKLMTEEEKLLFMREHELQKIEKMEEFNDQVEFLRKIIPSVKKQVKEISLKTEEFEINSFKDLQYFQEYYQIIFKCLGVILNGPSLGKLNSEPLNSSATESIEASKE